MSNRTYELRHAQRSARWVGTIIPLALTLIATVIVASAIPRLPAEIAIQFSFSGTPSSFAPSWLQLVLTLGLGGLLSLLPLLQTKQADDRAQVWGRNQRFMAAVMLGAVTMLQIMAVGTALLQVDLVDAAQMPNPTPVLIAGLAAWPILTVIGYAVQPHVVIDAPASDASAPIVLAQGERVMWVGGTAMSTWSLVLIGALIVSACGATLAMLLLGNVNWWVPAVLTVVLSVSALLATSYRVRIDHTGLTAKTPLGWPVFRVPANDIDSVTVGDINPFGEFGGWGVRSSLEGFGLVLRGGPGVRILRKNGRTFVVTLEDAETAASVLATVAAQAKKN